MSFDPAPMSIRRSYLEIDDGILPAIRVPISSWQATLQADRSSYVQAVIPSVLQYVDAISSRLNAGEIIIYHALRDISGTEQEWEVVRSPVNDFRIDTGPQRATATITGYVQLAAGGSSGDALVHYFPLDETSGSAVADTVGTLSGAVVDDPTDLTIIAGDTGFGNARDLDAIGDPSSSSRASAHIELWDGAPDLTYTLPAWTLVFKAKFDPDATGMSIVSMVYQDGEASFNNWWELRANDNREQVPERQALALLGQDNNGANIDRDTNVAGSPGGFLDGDWHQFAIASTGTQVQVIYDGVQVITQSASLLLLPKNPLGIGLSEFSSTAYFATDDIAIFNRALTAAEVAALAASPIEASAASTLRNVRSVSVSGGTRLRCDIDPTIKPGQAVHGAGYEFTVAYINLYANNSDAYMDVGERAL